MRVRTSSPVSRLDRDWALGAIWESGGREEQSGGRCETRGAWFFLCCAGAAHTRSRAQPNPRRSEGGRGPCGARLYGLRRLWRERKGAHSPTAAERRVRGERESFTLQFLPDPALGLDARQQERTAEGARPCTHHTHIRTHTTTQAMPPDGDTTTAAGTGGKEQASLSVADTNALRASLGLPPLREGPAPPDQAADRRAAAAAAAAAGAAAAGAAAIADRVTA